MKRRRKKQLTKDIEGFVRTGMFKGKGGRPLKARTYHKKSGREFEWGRLLRGEGHHELAGHSKKR